MVASLISWFIGFITVCSFTDIRISIVISTITCILYLRTTRKNDTLTYESRFAQSYI
jgi:ABC-type Fe3+-siderophore transport system permease subunit